MSNRPFVIFGLFALVVAVIVYFAFVKEGSEDAATVAVAATDEEEKQVFATNCGTCHTLAAAGTDGVVGPNLDEQIGGAAAGSVPEDQVTTTFESSYSRVLNAVTCGIEGRMPAGILQGDQAQAVSGFVAAYAGRLSEGAGPLVPADERETPPLQDCGQGS